MNHARFRRGIAKTSSVEISSTQPSRGVWKHSDYPLHVSLLADVALGDCTARILERGLFVGSNVAFELARIEAIWQR